MSSPIQTNIKRHLQAKNMSAAELERRTGIPHAVVNILHGRSKNPSLKTVQAIAKELGCSLEDLLLEDINRSISTPANQIPSWQPHIYRAVFDEVYKTIATLKLSPTAEQIGEWLSEVYEYTLGSPTATVDPRFVHWLLSR